MGPRPATSMSAFQATLCVWTMPATPSRTRVLKTSSPCPGKRVLGTLRGTGAKHLNVKNHGKTLDIWEYNWDIQYLVSDIGWN